MLIPIVRTPQRRLSKKSPAKVLDPENGINVHELDYVVSLQDIQFTFEIEIVYVFRQLQNCCVPLKI